MPSAPPPLAPLALLLLPEKLERFEGREHAEDLLRAPGVLAADPPAVSYTAIARLPLGLRIGVAARQAKRLLRALPSTPRAVIVYEDGQAALGLALLARAEERTELWYAEGAAAVRNADVHEVAEARAALRFPHPARRARYDNRALLERLEALGIESGRPGPERY